MVRNLSILKSRNSSFFPSFFDGPFCSVLLLVGFDVDSVSVFVCIFYIPALALVLWFTR